MRLALLAFALFAVSAFPPPAREVGEHLQKATVGILSDTGEGSGIVSMEGGKLHVWTAAHVVKGQLVVKVIQCVVKDGESHYWQHLADVVLIDNAEDVALLRIRGDGDGLEPIEWANELPPIGSPLIMAAAPNGVWLTATIHRGTLAGVGRKIEGIIYDQAAIHTTSGSSGGAICLPDGKCIGMVQRGINGSYSFYAPSRRLRAWVASVMVGGAFNAARLVPVDNRVEAAPVHP